MSGWRSFKSATQRLMLRRTAVGLARAGLSQAGLARAGMARTRHGPSVSWHLKRRSFLDGLVLLEATLALPRGPPGHDLAKRHVSRVELSELCVWRQPANGGHLGGRKGWPAAATL